MDKHSLFAEAISKLNNSEWKIVFDEKEWKAKIVSEAGEEMDMQTLGFTLGELNDYGKRRHEEVYGEPRKEPLDEFTKKRLNVMDYVLIEDKLSRNGKIRNVFEAYHGNAGLFTIENYDVSLENNLRYDDSGYTAYLNAMDAEKLLTPLQNFVNLHKQTPKR